MRFCIKVPAFTSMDVGYAKRHRQQTSLFTDGSLLCVPSERIVPVKSGIRHYARPAAETPKECLCYYVEQNSVAFRMNSMINKWSVKIQHAQKAPSSGRLLQILQSQMPQNVDSGNVT